MFSVAHIAVACPSSSGHVRSLHRVALRRSGSGSTHKETESSHVLNAGTFGARYFGHAIARNARHSGHSAHGQVCREWTGMLLVQSPSAVQLPAHASQVAPIVHKCRHITDVTAAAERDIGRQHVRSSYGEAGSGCCSDATEPFAKQPASVRQPPHRRTEGVPA